MKQFLIAILMLITAVGFAQPKQKLVDVLNRKTGAAILVSIPKNHVAVLLNLYGFVGTYKLVPAKRKHRS